ncbi:TetR/AcrR family transcriptional regulator [Tabrizicola sp.]|uniref:TetR/AcrR family transcriptional regulator n=1 Tax=Tabrizicola sp. TaxID=2005166 RepID=UPI003F3BC951
MTTTENAVGRGRPRKFDLETGLSTALKLFSRHGYDAVGISEICAALGITPTSLYAAYASKFNLFQRTIDRYANSSGRFVGKALAEAADPDDLWHRLLHAAAVQYASGPDKGCPVLDGLIGSRDPEVIAFIGERIEATRLAIRNRLAELGDPEADTNALAILVVMRGLSASARAGASVQDLTKVVDNLAQTRRPPKS